MKKGKQKLRATDIMIGFGFGIKLYPQTQTTRRIIKKMSQKMRKKHALV